MQPLRLLLVCVGILTTVQYGLSASVATRQDARPLPTIPNTFHTEIEVNIVNKNTTLRREEIYDYENNRARFDIYSEQGIFVEIFDYKTNLRYEINDWERCSLFNDAANKTAFLLDPNSPDHHLKNSSSFFRFGAQFEEEYIGQKSVRGILCDHWHAQATQQFPSFSAVSNYTIDYYFSVPEWIIQEGNHVEHRVPIRCEIQGNTTTTQDGAETTEPFHHIYEFVFFDIPTSTDNFDWYFQITTEFTCETNITKELPKLPEAFETGVEFTVVDQNFTSSIYEYYDYPNRNARFEFYRDGHAEIVIVNEKEGLLYEIVDHSKCSVRPLTQTPGRPMMNISQTFHFGDEFEEKYQGVRKVRGIPCDHWTSDVSRTQGTTTYNYTVDWYFSIQEWEMQSGGLHNHRIPVRVEMIGTIYYVNGTTAPMHRMGDFVNFIPGTPRGDVFVPSHDLFCGSTVNKSLPAIPSSFQTTIEFTIIEKNYTATLHEVFDYEKNRARFDFRREGQHVTTIVLLDENVRYTAVQGHNCTATKINGTALVDETGHLRTSSQLFHFGKEYEEHYQGIRWLRGIPCDVWLSNVTTTNSSFTIQWYFSIAEWEMLGTANPSHRIPVRAEVKGVVPRNGQPHPFHHIYDYVAFLPGPSHDEVFHIPHRWGCPGSEHETRNAFFFLVLELKVAVASVSEAQIASKLANLLGIQSSSVYTFKEDASLVGDVGTAIFVSIRAPEEMQAQVKARLEDTVAKNNFTAVTGYPISSSSFADHFACPNACSNRGRCHFGSCVCNSGYTGADCKTQVSVPSEDKTSEEPTSSSSGVSAGGAAGIAIISIIGGILVGGLGCYFVLRNKIIEKARSDAYQLQERE